MASALLGLPIPFTSEQRVDPIGSPPRLFDPRTNRWAEHLALKGVRHAGKSAIGRVTVTLLQINDDEHALERMWLQRLGEFP